MNLTNILVFAIFGLIFGFLVPQRWRAWGLLGSSILAIYWLQPSTPIRSLDFWFPTASIGLTIFVWAVTRQSATNKHNLTTIAAIFIFGFIILIGLTRYFDFLCCLTPTRPPDILRIILAIGLLAAGLAIPYLLLPKNRYLPSFTILIIIALFVILKTEPFARSVSALLRISTSQPSHLAEAIDLPWLGFSYLAFRLLHVLRDDQSGKLPAYSLSEFVTYAIFFPAYAAGPIDRSQRFIGDLRRVNASEDFSFQVNGRSNRFMGFQRIIIGAFKKFVLADSLALVALNSQNAGQVNSTAWLWVLLYAYALRIYLDFAGYTDIAIGLGMLLGVQLPENFDKPYFKLNLTTFWNSWHITLAQWFRAYYFNPLTRSLRSRNIFPTWVIIVVGQMSTMILIGLWHGITWNFAIWGAWHGIGLFIHNRWSNWLRPLLDGRSFHPSLTKVINFSSWIITFNYVSLGWVWFLLPNPYLSLDVFRKLFNL